jgi:hypothetical protein
MASTPMTPEDTDERLYDYYYEDGGSDRFASDSAFEGGAHTTHDVMTFDPMSCWYLHTKRATGAQVLSNANIGETCTPKGHTKAISTNLGAPGYYRILAPIYQGVSSFTVGCGNCSSSGNSCVIGLVPSVGTSIALPSAVLTYARASTDWSSAVF